MKKVKILSFLFLAAVMLLIGCGAKQENEKEYTVYYVNTAGTRLVESSYSPVAETFDAMMIELMGQLAAAPSGYVSPLTAGVKFNGYERGIDALRVDFSQEYYNMTNTEEVLMQAAVVKTVCQIPGVMKVMITVEKEQAKDSSGDPIPAMDVNTFIDTKEGGINSYLYATLSLYFPDKEGEITSLEMRNIHYSSNMVLERLVVEELIKGPETSGLRSAFSEEVRIQNIYTQNGICTINFDESINKVPSESAADAETALYSIVNSICATCDSITGVKFEIDGDSEIKFRNEMELDQIFMMNENLIRKENLEETELKETELKETVLTEPETGSISQEPAVPETAGAEEGVQTEVVPEVQETSVEESETKKAEEVITGTPIAGVNPSAPEG